MARFISAAWGYFFTEMDFDMSNITGGISFDIQSNWRETQAELDAIGRQVLPMAMASMMNKVAFDTRSAMITYMKSGVIDRPKAFTLRAFKVDKADWRDGDQMKARIFVQPEQAKYFHFLIMGGTRHPQDSGSGEFNDFLTYSKRPTAQGGAYSKNFVKKVSRENRQERLERRAARASRASSRQANGYRGTGQSDVRWLSQHPEPGTFFGTIHGIKGIWKRPARMTAAERFAKFGKHLERHMNDVDIAERRIARGQDLSPLKQRVRDAYALHQAGGLPRLKDMPWTKPGQKATLLLGFSSEVPYQARFDYDGTLMSIVNTRLTDASYATSIRYYKDKLARNSNLMNS